MLEVSEHPVQHPVGACRIDDEKPVLPTLIVDGKVMARVGEVDPGFGDVVGDEAGERGAGQAFDVVAHVILQRRLRQPGEVPRAVFHA